MYAWLTGILQEEYQQVRVLKESPRGSVRIIRHKATGRKLILRKYTGSAEVYRRLLAYSCGNLPQVLEVVSPGRGKPGPGGTD